MVAHAAERARIKFNDGFQRLIQWYVDHVSEVVDRKWLFLGIYAAACVALVLLFTRLPTGFVPTEDQGAIQVQYRLPPGATLGQTRQVQRAIEDYFLNGPEKKNVGQYFTVAGGGQGASGQNTGQAFVSLADYSKRPGSQNSADAIVQRASAAFRGFPQCAGVRRHPTVDPRPRTGRRLHHGASEHGRHAAGQFRRRYATSCSRRKRRSRFVAGPAEPAARYADAQGHRRPADALIA